MDQGQIEAAIKQVGDEIRAKKEVGEDIKDLIPQLQELKRKFEEDNLASIRGDIALMAAASDEAHTKIARAHTQCKRCRDRIDALRRSLGIDPLRDGLSTAAMRTDTLAELARSGFRT